MVEVTSECCPYSPKTVGVTRHRIICNDCRDRRDEKQSESDNIRKCSCKVDTVVGVRPLLGKVVKDHEKLLGGKLKLVTHLAEIPSGKYDIIIGCGLMERVKSYKEIMNGRWRIELGMKAIAQPVNWMEESYHC